LLTTAAQFTALTSFEAYLIQLWVLRRAKGLPDLDPPFRPADHVFASFEYRIPLSLGPQASPLVMAHLVDNGHASDVDVTSPSFRCIKSKPLKQYVGTGLTSGISMAWLIRHGGWRKSNAALRLARTPGRPPPPSGQCTRSDDSTCAKLKQIQEEDFDWEVVKSWKLRYNWER